mgnify:CR=1 FL=1
MDVVKPTYKALSPSSRRAWIEICDRFARSRSSLVALLAEGVDRNIVADVLTD